MKKYSVAFVSTLAMMIMVMACEESLVSCGQFDPHESVCSGDKYEAGDTYGTIAAVAISHAVAEATTVASRDSYKDWQMTPPQLSAYAHASCDDDDASGTECSGCLREAWRNLRMECAYSMGARVTQWRCYLRYESYKFEY